MKAIFVGNDHRDRDKHLHEFCYAVNMAMQLATRVFPAFLNYGRQPQPGKSLRWVVENWGPKLLLDQEVWATRMRRLDALRDLVGKHIDESKSKTARRYNVVRKIVRFNIGDWVMRRIKTKTKKAEGISVELAPKYDGSFRISGFSLPAVYWLEGVDKRQSDKIQVDWLKRYVPPRRAR